MAERQRVRGGPGVVALVVGIVMALLGLGYIGYTVLSGMRGTTPVAPAPIRASRRAP